MSSPKRIIKTLYRDKRGSRFQNFYRRVQPFFRGHPFKAFFFLVLGLIFFLIGIIFLITPGPGLLFLLLGMAAWAAQAAFLARWLDQTEVWVHRRSRVPRKLFRKWWKKSS